MSVTVTAELVASVLNVSVEVGQQVKAGDELLMLDSMKMEIPVLAETDGAISEVLVSPGDHVREGDPLVVVSRA